MECQAAVLGKDGTQNTQDFSFGMMWNEFSIASIPGSIWFCGCQKRKGSRVVAVAFAHHLGTGHGIWDADASRTTGPVVAGPVPPHAFYPHPVHPVIHGYYAYPAYGWNGHLVAEAEALHLPKGLHTGWMWFYGTFLARFLNKTHLHAECFSNF